jgi:ribonuclease BN (tRNA processing enzyme)
MLEICRLTWMSVLFVLPTAAIATAGAAADAQCLHSQVSLQVLGSGGPEFYPNRASTSYLVRHKGQGVVLVDAGSGSKFRFAQSGADFNTVQALLFTHFHVDHSADFSGYIKSAFFSDRNQDLFVFGPEGNSLFPSAQEFARASIGSDAGAYPYLSRYLEGGDEYRIVVKDIKIDKHEVQSVATLNDINFSAIPVHHAQVPAVAWRVDIGGKSIVFSGDMNGDYDTLAKLAKNADLLVAHNAITEGTTGVARNLHMPPSVIGNIAKKAGVKQLILSHRMRRTLGNEAQTLSIIKEKYKGIIKFANDLDCFIP